MMLLKDKALCLKENPEYPYVGVSFQNGVLSLISVYDPDKLTFMTSFHLTKNPLSSIYFTEIGKMIVVADLTIGQFFIIEVKVYLFFATCDVLQRIIVFCGCFRDILAEKCKSSQL